MFVRWHPSRYHYTLFILARSLSASIVCTVLPYDPPEVQINALTNVLLTALGTQLILWPHRSDEANILDAVVTMALLLGLDFAATGIGGTVDYATSVIIAVVVAGSLSSGGLLVLTKRWSAAKRAAAYKIFLSHHKGGGGLTARLLKLARPLHLGEHLLRQRQPELRGPPLRRRESFGERRCHLQRRRVLPRLVHREDRHRASKRCQHRASRAGTSRLGGRPLHAARRRGSRGDVEELRGSLTLRHLPG